MVQGGDNKNGESKLAGKAAFNSDFNFNLYEYFHFCSKMLKKDDKKSPARGRSSNSPCMIVFTDPGDVVIDPCCGSGTTLRAAYELGRSSFGFEIDRTFYTRAKEEMIAPLLKDAEEMRKDA